MLAATFLCLLALPIAPAQHSRLQPVDFELLKQAEQQAAQDKAAQDAAKKAQADKEAADKEAADKAAADKAAADKAAADKAAADKAAADKLVADKAASAPPSPLPPPEARAAHVALKLASGTAAGSAALTETPDGLRFLLAFANIPSGKYRLAILPRASCGKPYAAAGSPAPAIPTVTADAGGTVAAAFTVRALKLEDAADKVMALYPETQADAPWTACGAATR